ncbi:MAG: HYD1 signature containing ADP-ribosyltransferase family protein [Planctomycetota bacterium]
MGLYHYTTEPSHAGLMEADRLVPSKARQDDSAHGPGWYLTDLGPSACEKTLMQYCWARVESDERVRHYLEMEVDASSVYKLRKHVYFVPDGPSAHFELISQGEVLECTLKPCEACALNQEKA